MRKGIKGIILLWIVATFGACSGWLINFAPQTPLELWAGPKSPLLYGSEGSDTSLLVVQDGDLYGYADPNGKIVIKPQFLDARPFCEGLAAVSRNYEYGYIDKTGKVVIPFRYYGAGVAPTGSARDWPGC